MIDTVIVVGAGGVLGGGISRCLRNFGRNVISVSARQIVERRLSIDRTTQDLVSEAFTTPRSDRRLGVVLAHRYRGRDPAEALSIEIAVTRDFIWALASNVNLLRAVVIGSSTESFACDHLTEAYHYGKDIQRSITRQSCRLSNVQMNLLALSWFEKYEPSHQSDEYSAVISGIKQRIGDLNFPKIYDISDFINQMMRSSLTPRGQIITYDGGLSILQSGL